MDVMVVGGSNGTEIDPGDGDIGFLEKDDADIDPQMPTSPSSSSSSATPPPTFCFFRLRLGP
jgi:hypothetical protein